jgi:hypothetical protein
LEILFSFLGQRVEVVFGVVDVDGGHGVILLGVPTKKNPLLFRAVGRSLFAPCMTQDAGYPD